jgi:hypothetical protein
LGAVDERVSGMGHAQTNAKHRLATGDGKRVKILFPPPNVNKGYRAEGSRPQAVSKQ